MPSGNTAILQISSVICIVSIKFIFFPQSARSRHDIARYEKYNKKDIVNLSKRFRSLFTFSLGNDGCHWFQIRKPQHKHSSHRTNAEPQLRRCKQWKQGMTRDNKASRSVHNMSYEPHGILHNKPWTPSFPNDHKMIISPNICMIDITSIEILIFSV